MRPGQSGWKFVGAGLPRVQASDWRHSRMQSTRRKWKPTSTASVPIGIRHASSVRRRRREKDVESASERGPFLHLRVWRSGSEATAAIRPANELLWLWDRRPELIDQS